MNSSFGRAPSNELSIRKNLVKMQYLVIFVRSIDKCYQLDFPKVDISNYSTKRAISSSSRRVPCT